MRLNPGKKADTKQNVALSLTFDALEWSNFCFQHSEKATTVVFHLSLILVALTNLMEVKRSIFGLDEGRKRLLILQGITWIASKYEISVRGISVFHAILRSYIFKCNLQLIFVII